MNNSSAPAWLREFFGGSNDLHWQDLKAGTLPDGWAPEIHAWLELLEGNSEAAILLPTVNASGEVTWYGVARVARAAYALAEDLGGFIGQTYGGFDGRPYLPQPADTGGIILAREFPGPMYQIGPVIPDNAIRIRRSLARYRRLIDRRPSTGRLATRSVGALRSRFDRALLAGDETEAIRLHDEMLASGRLSWDNRVYLRIRLLAGLGQWPDIARNASLLRQARDLALPAQVRTEILEALYRTFAEPFEDPDDPGRALSAFETAGVQQLAPIFSTRQGIGQPRVIKAFLLYALLRKDVFPTELTELCSLLPETTPRDAAFAVALRGLVAARTGAAVAAQQPDPSHAADDAYDDMEFDRALELYASLPPSRRIVCRMVQCAKLIGTLTAAKKAVAAVDALGEEEEALPPTLRTIVEDFRMATVPAVPSTASSGETEPTQPGLPDDWLSWARWVSEGADRKAAHRRAEQRAATWPVECFREGSHAQELAKHLGNASVNAPDVLQDAFPQIFQAFVISHDGPVATWRPIYSNLLTAIAMFGSRSIDDLELARVLTSYLIDIGLDATEYDGLIRDLNEILGAEASLATLDWALDLAEVLLTNRSALPDARLALIVNVFEVAKARAHRLAISQIEALRMLCEDIAIDPPTYLQRLPAATEDPSSAADLADRSVAIYTLAETAGRRAAKMLLHIAPSVRVSLNSDHVCTERLAGLARSADLFVFAWRSSKHAAYYCVKDHRPSDRPILTPCGKGSASIINAVLGR